MSQLQDTEAPDLPCSDKEYSEGVEFLSKNCAAFQRYRREQRQFIGDNLSSANLLIGASIVSRDQPYQTVSTERLELLRTINKSIFEKLRGE